MYTRGQATKQTAMRSSGLLQGEQKKSSSSSAFKADSSWSAPKKSSSAYSPISVQSKIRSERSHFAASPMKRVSYAPMKRTDMPGPFSEVQKFLMTFATMMVQFLIGDLRDPKVQKKNACMNKVDNNHARYREAQRLSRRQKTIDDFNKKNQKLHKMRLEAKKKKGPPMLQRR